MDRHVVLSACVSTVSVAADGGLKSAIPVPAVPDRRSRLVGFHSGEGDLGVWEPGVAPPAGNHAQDEGIGPVAAPYPEGGRHGHPVGRRSIVGPSRSGGMAFQEIRGGVASQKRLVAEGGNQQVPVGGHPTKVEVL